MFTVMLWQNKGELRVVRTDADQEPGGAWLRRYNDQRMREMLPFRGAPVFATADEGWDWITREHPELAP